MGEYSRGAHESSIVRHLEQYVFGSSLDPSILIAYLGKEVTEEYSLDQVRTSFKINIRVLC